MKACIDIGGTNIRVGIIDHKLQLSNLKTMRTVDPLTSLNWVIDQLNGFEFEQINISTCGPIDLETGIYGQLPNLDSWNHFNLKTYLSKNFKCQINIENDANCAALFEAETRPGVDSLVYITISTGVGAGAVINNKLFRGDRNQALSPHKYYINLESTLDQACSGTGLLKAAQKFGSYLETKDVFADQKNCRVDELLTEWVDRLALYIVNTDSCLDIKQFVLGGSVICNNPRFVEQIRKKVNSLDDDIEIELTSELEYNALKGAYLINKYK